MQIINIGIMVLLIAIGLMAGILFGDAMRAILTYNRRRREEEEYREMRRRKINESNENSAQKGKGETDDTD